jgi:hypothetical protein
MPLPHLRVTVQLGLSCSRRTWNLRGHEFAYPFHPEDSIP